MKSLLCGVDLGGTKVVCALVTTDGEIVVKNEFRGHKSLTADETVAQISSHIKELLTEAGVSKSDIQGVGVGACGHVNHDTGRVITNSQLRDFRDYPLAEKLSDAVGMDVVIDNDANAQAYAEYLFGSARGFSSATFVTVSTGIGAGFVIDGRLFRGSAGTAGEIGHTIINPHGTIRCGCGNYGCLFAHAAGQSLPQIVGQKLLRPGIQTTIDFNGLEDHEITGELIGQGFEAGDPLCTEVVMECADYLGMGLQNLFQIMDPDVIVLGGGLTNWGQRYLDRIRTRFYRTAGRMLSHPLEIKVATLHANAAFIGAAALVLEPK
ncbi:MAG: ROK family protein [Spirochaetota bacterium]